MRSDPSKPLYESDLWQELNDGLRRPGGLELTGYAVELSGLSDNQLILDLGCGAGITAGYITECFNMSVVGIDKSEKLLREAVNRFPGCSFVKGRAEALPFESDVFSAVIAECSLSLCEDLSAVLSEIHRVLSDNGKLIITDMYKRNPQGGYISESSEPSSSCFQRLRPENDWISGLNNAGFKLLHHEDRTRDLSSLAANIIFEYGSLDAFFRTAGTSACTCSGRPGYFLIIARKK